MTLTIETASDLIETKARAGMALGQAMNLVLEAIDAFDNLTGFNVGHDCEGRIYLKTGGTLTKADLGFTIGAICPPA